MSEPLKNPLLNQYVGYGRLTRDPEFRHTSASNTAVCTFGIAITTSFKKNEEGKYDAIFLDVKAWGQLADKCHEGLKKGRPIIVIGNLGLDKWKDRDTGAPKERMYINAQSVQRLSWDHNPDEDPAQPKPPVTTGPPAATGGDDDLPF